MRVLLRNLIDRLTEMFWILPGLLVLGGVFGAFGLIAIDRSGIISPAVLEGSWLYNGGATGARTLLGAVASSTIGVAGTIFSITIAALSLAAGQMGPRLLRNFVRDRGNQLTLGVFLGTFAYALMVLRSVRTKAEGEFVPHLSLTVAIVLALVCVATLIFFVGHMARRINVDVVIELVSRDVRSAIRRLTSTKRGPHAVPSSFWEQATIVRDSRRGYLQNLDAEALAAWAAERRTAMKLLVRIGDYIFPGSPIALVTSAVQGADLAILRTTALAAQRASADDMEYAVRQLVEVAVRALSPGINDPHTAISVLDRLGEALCDIAALHLPAEMILHSGKPCLMIPNVNYDGLTDEMFHLIRQNARGSAAVLIRTLEVLTAVAACERDSERLRALSRHASLVVGDAERDIPTPSDLSDLRARHLRFIDMADNGPTSKALAAW